MCLDPSSSVSNDDHVARLSGRSQRHTADAANRNTVWSGRARQSCDWKGSKDAQAGSS